MESQLDYPVGTIVEGTYEVLGVLGEGGMGRVYRVRHLAWDIDLAVKTPRPDLASDPELLRIFVQEAETWVGLGAHPHIVQCHYVRNLRGLPHVFAERVDGGSLAAAIERRALYAGKEREVLARVIDVALQCAWGLALAHDAGVVHQDIKPANILLTADGVAKVCDFGLAKSKPGGRTGDEKHTFAGMTPAYASPEQRRASRTGEFRDAITSETDIWSWAVSVLHMLAGEVTWLDGSVAREAALAYAEGGDSAAVAVAPPGLMKLLIECLHEVPGERPRAADIATSLLALRRSVLDEPYPREVPEPGSFLTGGLNNRALSLLDLGKKAEAAAALGEAVARDPRHAVAVYNRGLVAWRGGDATDRDVLGAIADAASLESASHEHYLNSGWVHLERGDALGAWEQGRRAESLASTPLDREDVARHAAAYREVLRDDHGGPIPPPIQAHAGELRAAAFTRDGRLALTGGEDGSLRLVSLLEGRVLREIVRKGPAIRALAIAADGARACAADWDGVTWSIDVETAKRKRLGKDHDAALAITADGSTLFATSDRHFHVWDLGSSRKTRELEEGTGQLSFSADGLHLGWPFSDRLYLWDREGAPRSIKGHVDDPEYAKFLNDLHLRLTVPALRRRPASTGRGRSPRTAGGPIAGLDVVQLMEDSRITLRGRAISVVPVRRGEALASCGHDQTVRLWSVATGKVERWMSGVRAVYEHLAVDEDETLLFGAAGELLGVWELATGRLLRTERVPAKIVALAACARGRRIAIATADGALRLLAHAPSRPAPLLLCHPRAALLDAEVVHRQRSLHACIETALRDGRRAEAVRAFHDLVALPGHELSEPTLALERRLSAIAGRGPLRAVVAVPAVSLASESADATVAISADGERLAFCSGRKAMLIGRGRTRVLCIDDGVFFAFAMALDGFRVAAAAYGKLLHWPAIGMADWMLELAATPSPLDLSAFTRGGSAAGAPPAAEPPRGVRRWPRHLLGMPRFDRGRPFELEPELLPVFTTGSIRAIALGKKMEVVCATAEEMRIFDLADGRERIRLRRGARCVALTPDGRLLASGNEDGDIELWPLGSGERARGKKGAHRGAVRAIAISAAGDVVVSAGADGVVQRLIVRDGTCAAFGERHSAPARGVAMTPDGSVAVSCGEDAMVHIHDVRTGQCLRALAGGPRKLTSVAISADAHTVVAANDAGEVRKWRLHWHLVPPDGCRPGD